MAPKLTEEQRKEFAAAREAILKKPPKFDGSPPKLTEAQKKEFAAIREEINKKLRNYNTSPPKLAMSPKITEDQKKNFADAREETIKKPRTFDTSPPKQEEKDFAQAQQNVLNKVRERFSDLFLAEDSDQRNHDIYYCLNKGVCKDQEKKLLSCFLKADAAGADVNECCNAEILEMKSCINKCLYKLLEKKMDFLRLISEMPHYYSS